jgi:hypothetical protein
MMCNRALRKFINSNGAFSEGLREFSMQTAILKAFAEIREEPDEFLMTLRENHVELSGFLERMSFGF